MNIEETDRDERAAAVYDELASLGILNYAVVGEWEDRSEYERERWRCAVARALPVPGDRPPAEREPS